ncbi:MAG: NAD(P)(+) transhydrogenase (Re/Si-specific) subunit beta [Deltaproteobacteria bacterium]|nr:NAD(P)(+) transhydrogenase (Re/Si-specific) subunit beta [Deltaproteobacteria bacterium]MDQ3296143.1 NAD(P)(+) transhydrogenase (Re/Si-specific) subunit beta [Myxococcota bacterium]
MSPEIKLWIFRGALFVASCLFLLGLRALTSAETARRGMWMAAIGMALGVAGTLLHKDVVSYHWIAIGLVVGTVIGVPMGRWIPMTKMPERIALSHAFGGAAVALVGLAEYLHRGNTLGSFGMGAIGFEVVMGAVTFTGSLVAFGKLQGTISGKPLGFRGGHLLNAILAVACLTGIAILIARPEQTVVFYGVIALSAVLGVLLVLPIGGADMPVIICLLNAYAGLAASASGFALDNQILIICGALDGGSGLILALIMSKAMNRSFRNVLFGGVGAGAAATAGSGEAKPSREASIEDAAELLKIASSVIVVPGYGMAVAQAQHAVRDLAGVLAANGVNVRYAIHPVAGRMPGHMNVLLAEANVPYDQLFELDAINDDFRQTDVTIVVGANDVVNPAAKSSPSSPIFGMPILNADQSKAVIVLKRSQNPGFAGIENELFVQPNTMMVLGDAKHTLGKLSAAVKGSHN